MLKSLKKRLPKPLRKPFKKLYKRYRIATSAWRTLPHFIIIGAMKSGTSSLFSYLIQHPQIMGSYKKEVHFFDWNYSKGTSRYRSHFPLARAVKPGMLAGEASPSYLYSPRAPARIHALLPQARLIALLRNPTERAISHYFHAVRTHRESLPLMEALWAEEERIAPALEKMRRDEFFKSPELVWHSYKKRGIYVEQLKRYWRYFDKDQLLIVNSDAIFNDPRAALKRIFTFLGVDPDVEIRNLAAENVGGNRTDVPLSVYAYLDAFFAPYNEELYEHIQQDFGW